MAVEVTQAFRQGLGNVEADILEFANAFEQWRTGWPACEYQSELFGKDSAYCAPEVAGRKYALRHVHLKPIQDKAQLALWFKRFVFKSRKTSDRVLVYCRNERTEDYMLIFILPEPDAHTVAKMATVADRSLMHGFARAAAAFLDDGSIIS